MRTPAGIAFGIIALAAIVGLAVSSATVEQERLLAEFTAETERQVHASAEALSRLDSIHQDVRMLADLVERSRRNPDLDVATERRVWESAFRALAVVVAQYRVTALVGDDGALEVQAIDPSEDPRAAMVLLPQVQRLGKEAARDGRERLGAPVRIGARSFLLYAVPTRGGGAIVVASDGALLLRAVAWPQLSAGRLFVTDPSGVVWAGCETARGCDVAGAGIPGHYLSGKRGARVPIDPRRAAALGLDPAPAVAVSEKVPRPTGSWLVTWIASMQPIENRERVALARTVATSISAAVVVAVIGIILLRQQRRAADLGNQLRYAQAVAKAHELESQLVRADRLITVGVMATEIAHEIGTPLAVVRGRAEQVLPTLNGGTGTDDLRVVIKQVDHISATIRQLLDFSRRSPLEVRAVSLAAVVDRTRELLRLKIEARRLHLQVDLSEDLPTLTADPDQLQQVLVNLLLNACDASRPGDRVSLSATGAPKDMVLIRLVDQGSGIAPENLTAIFDPFFTTKPRGEGTGLGLSIVAGIVRNHGGQIDLRSVPGEGTTVSVLWPAGRHPEHHDA